MSWPMHADGQVSSVSHHTALSACSPAHSVAVSGSRLPVGRVDGAADDRVSAGCGTSRLLPLKNLEKKPRRGLAVGSIATAPAKQKITTCRAQTKHRYRHTDTQTQTHTQHTHIHTHTHTHLPHDKLHPQTETPQLPWVTRVYAHGGGGDTRSASRTMTILLTFASRSSSARFTVATSARSLCTPPHMQMR